MAFTLKINGEQHTLDVDAEMPLLWAIRDVVGLTGVLRSLCRVVAPYSRGASFSPSGRSPLTLLSHIVFFDKAPQRSLNKDGHITSNDLNSSTVQNFCIAVAVRVDRSRSKKFPPLDTGFEGFSPRTHERPRRYIHE